jgi:hypothetical protein
MGRMDLGVLQQERKSGIGVCNSLFYLYDGKIKEYPLERLGASEQYFAQG